MTVPSLATGPVITSKGYTKLLLTQAAGPMFAAAGTVSQPVYVTRSVQVTTKLDALLSVTMAAKKDINLSGNNISSDSFDTGDPLYNTGSSTNPRLGGASFSVRPGRPVLDRITSQRWPSSSSRQQSQRWSRRYQSCSKCSPEGPW